MKQQTWTFIDKTAWGGGLWQDEPDKVQWTDGATGLVCLARRGPLGSWCGYVGIAPDHPLFEVEYSTCPTMCGADYCEHRPETALDVHGGITYSDACQETEQPYGICHIPEPGQPDHVWWFGFDCAHAGDLVPGLFVDIRAYLPLLKPGSDIYRDLAYVQAECRRLAAQLQALGNATT
jgi:hypothetical protein